MVCPKCKKSNRDGAKLCRFCGELLEKKFTQTRGDHPTMPSVKVTRRPTPPSTPVVGPAASEGDHATVMAPEHGRVTLEVVEGPMTGRDFVFEEHDTFLFGRTQECHAFLPDDTFASRHHFLLEVNPPQVRIRDLGSLNGTFVNKLKCGGRRLDETPEQGSQRRFPQVDLEDGDTIQIGATIFRTGITAPETVEVRCVRCNAVIQGIAKADVDAEHTCGACRTKHEDDPLSILIESKRDDQDDEKEVGGELPQIPGYAIGKKLGQGGMGAVYLAKRNSDGQELALKVLLSQVAVNEKNRERFLRETQLLKDLQHPNIVGFNECGSSGCLFWFVTEYCNGGTILELMRKYAGVIPMRHASVIMMQVLRALEYAHDRDLVHRDMKPANILVHRENGRGIARIADFGLAKNFEKAGFSGMTMTGGYGGTFPFMAREQLTNFKYVRPVSDVWGAAASFYYMLSGHFPREQRSSQDPMQAILEGKIIPIRKRSPEIPAPLAEVLHLALIDDPAKRYPTAREFAQAMQKALTD